MPEIMSLTVSDEERIEQAWNNLTTEEEPFTEVFNVTLGSTEDEYFSTETAMSTLIPPIPPPSPKICNYVHNNLLNA